MQHPLIRYHGGKFRIADWIIAQFPVHKIYVEPFGGGASVLLSKTPSPVEVYNDLDDEVVNLFRVLRSDKAELLAQKIYLTPFSRTELTDAYVICQDPVEIARRLIVRAQMSFGSAGATRAQHGFRYGETTKGYSKATLWNKQPEIIMQVVERLKHVFIENRDAIKCIQDHDSPDTLFFVDPPYLSDTRQSSNQYNHEMTNLQHEELLQVLLGLKGKVILSGYDHPTYNEALAGWKKLTKSVRALGNGGGVTRTECLWINPAAQVPDLFTGGAA
jgi:DNA adenine methylase